MTGGPQNVQPTSEPRMKTALPDWFNIIFAAVILCTVVYGTVVFMNKEYNPAVGIANFWAYFPAFITAFMYGMLLFITTLFADYDLSTVMFLILLVTGLVVLTFGAFSKGEREQAKYFEVASAVLGLALGIPFGEKLRRDRHTA